MSQPLIETRDLRYRYDDGTVALDGIDFRLDPAETVALLGPNGSGKTTFVLHLNGLLRGHGHVSVCGMPVRKENLRAVRQRVGLVFQDSDNQLFMPTVMDDVSFGPLNLGISPEETLDRARAALDRVGMAELAYKPPYHLSAGEKKRAALAGILAMNPEVLVLDEPTTFLDPPGQRKLIGLLQSLPQAKILVTHDVDFARALAQRAVFFQKGKIAADGPIEEILSRFDWDRRPAARQAAWAARR